MLTTIKETFALIKQVIMENSGFKSTIFPSLWSLWNEGIFIIFQTKISNTQNWN